MRSRSIVVLAFLLLCNLFLALSVLAEDSPKGNVEVASRLATINSARYKKMFDKPFPLANGEVSQAFFKSYKEKTDKIDLVGFLSKSYADSFTAAELEEILKYVGSDAVQRYAELEPQFLVQAQGRLMKKMFAPVMQQSPMLQQPPSGDGQKKSDGSFGGANAKLQQLNDAMNKLMEGPLGNKVADEPKPVSKEQLAAAKPLAEQVMASSPLPSKDFEDILQQLYAENFSESELKQLTDWQKTEVCKKYRNTAKVVDGQMAMMFLPQFGAAAQQALAEVQKKFGSSMMNPGATGSGTANGNATKRMKPPVSTRQQINVSEGSGGGCEGGQDPATVPSDKSGN